MRVRPPHLGDPTRHLHGLFFIELGRERMVRQRRIAETKCSEHRNDKGNS